MYYCWFDIRYIEVSGYLQKFNTDTSWYRDTSIFLVSKVSILYGTLSNALVKSRMAISTDFFSSRDLLMSWTI